MENTNIDVCPQCGNIRMEMPKNDPQLAEEVFKLITKASIIANQKLKEENTLFAPADDTRPAHVHIRQYFEKLKEDVEEAQTLKELLAVKDTISSSELHTPESLVRAFRRQRETMLDYVNSRIEEYVEKEDNLTDDEKDLRSSPEFQDKKAAALAIIQHMQNSPIPFKDIVERLGHIGLKIGDIMRIVEQLKREGEIFEPLKDHLQVI